MYTDWVSDADDAVFKDSSDRYVLYINLGCPWACSALTIIHLRGLQDSIKVVCTKAETVNKEWVFDPREKTDLQVFAERKDWIFFEDPVYGAKTLREVYTKATNCKNLKGPFTHPVLVDLTGRKIVNNISSDICKMLCTQFNKSATIEPKDKKGFFQTNLRHEIEKCDAENEKDLMQMVYIAGFSQDQQQYDQAIEKVFNRLELLNTKMQGRQEPYLVANRLTYADIRLFQFLVRFDAVYYFHFRCNKKPLRKYDNLNRYVQTLYNKPYHLGDLVDMDHIKRHYYRSHRALNRKGIIPEGPEEWWAKSAKKDQKSKKNK